MNRRALIRAMGMSAVALTSRSLAQSTTPIAQTTCGKVRGHNVDGTHVFKGIRYGATTAGSYRFLPPRAPEPWPGVVDALEDGPQCFQKDPLEQPSRRWSDLPESEDCLKLNVWTPALRDGKKRPVMVWLHGGGLWRGSVAGEWHAGRRLSRRGDVVVVSPNHRLNVFGYAYLEGLGDSCFSGGGNAGLLDLVLALQWVQDNIEEFGGDAHNVTLFGQSGGGQKVSFLMAMPAAEGLFHKAIIQSGPAPLALEADYSTWMARQLLDKLGLTASSARKIQDVPPAHILRAYYELFHAIGGYGVMGILQGFAPTLDAKTLRQQPFWNGAPAGSKNIPLLIGSTRTEMTGYTLRAEPNAHLMTWPQIEDELALLLNEHAGTILQQFRKNHPHASSWEIYSLILSDWPTRAFSILIAQEQAKLEGAPVRMYRMDWQTPVQNGLLMSPHALDVAFVLDTVNADVDANGGGPAAQAMANQMSDAWLAFARTGNPQTPALPHWPAYDEKQRATLLFNLPSRLALDPDGGDRRVIQDFMRTYRPARPPA